MGYEWDFECSITILAGLTETRELIRRASWRWKFTFDLTFNFCLSTIGADVSGWCHEHLRMRRPVVTRCLKLFFYLLPSTLLVYTSTTLLFSDRGAYFKKDGAMTVQVKGMSIVHTSIGSGSSLPNSAASNSDNSVLKWINKSVHGTLNTGKICFTYSAYNYTVTPLQTSRPTITKEIC